MTVSPVLAAQPLTLTELLTRHATRLGLQSTAVPGLHLYRAVAASEPVHTVYTPSVCLVAQGRKLVQQGEASLAYGPEDLLLVSVSLPLTARILEASPDRPHLALHVDLAPALIAALAVEFPETAPGAGSQAGLVVTALEPLVQGAVLRLVRLLDTPQHIPALAPLILRELGYLLLVGPEGGRLRAMVQAAGQTHRIATAIERLVREYDRPLRVEQMARDVHMSVSGFHHHFKAVTALSPLQFQKRLRLQEARRLLLGRELDVTGAGFRVGYDSPSQFSREYRRLFGVSPRQDVMRWQVGGPVVPGAA
ncbi:AraC family transcriptional regulator [Deinococcus humi]|uniref:AraC-like DNA-binding protein n=1 Tax=Deinococcus humi TaxID=662880 RepID=A0A7W8JYM7_9DEIO|nr:AraC family transcriptional regulator [Deinococcus humi]MBB5365637.1 AraC-like DNA-binding protein [Deinococcus humi]GGO36886.1 AraC family transcriptional regulator [Deinococcus humi]